MEQYFTPYTGKWLSFLWGEHLLPSFISKKKLLVLNNRIACEAHRDVFINYLNHKFNEYNQESNKCTST